jgi:rod shape-determining protein MreC
VYDKTVRRRRAVLAALVVLSLILLTAYFGEAPGGALHSVQRGFLTVVSPIQDGADKALKPFRDLFGWVGDTLKAKGQVGQLRKQVEQLRKNQINATAAERQVAEYRKLLGLDTQLSLSHYQPVAAHVIERDPTLFYAQVGIDAGTGAGVQVDDPVIDADGLIGKITAVTPNAAIVTLLTDPSSGVSAMINKTGADGVIQAKYGDPNTLQLTYLPASANVQVGEDVVTAGTVSTRLGDLFPPELPIGTVTGINNSGGLNQTVDVRPFANLRQLDLVQALTRNTRGNRLSQAVAQLRQQAGGSSSSTQTASTGGHG